MSKKEYSVLQSCSEACGRFTFLAICLPMPQCWVTSGTHRPPWTLQTVGKTQAHTAVVFLLLKWAYCLMPIPASYWWCCLGCKTVQPGPWNSACPEAGPVALSAGTGLRSRTVKICSMLGFTSLASNHKHSPMILCCLHKVVGRMIKAASQLVYYVGLLVLRPCALLGVHNIPVRGWWYMPQQSCLMRVQLSTWYWGKYWDFIHRHLPRQGNS